MPSPEEYRNLELEAVAATSVARGSATLGRLVRFGVPLGALAFAGWMIFASVGPGRKPLTAPDPDEFTMRPYPAPSLEPPRTPGNQETITVPPALASPEPPPPPPPEPPAAVPPPPPEPPITDNGLDDEEARRLAELERQRREEEERRRWERLRAPQVITDNASLDPAPGSAEASLAPGGEADDDPNRRFLASVGNAGVEVARATTTQRIDALVAQGTMIRGVLETAVQSDLPGMVRAVVTEDVWSFDGRRVLIPAGSRLIGEYKSGLAQGQTRVFMVWSRMLRSDGVSVQLASGGTDSLGRAGNAGFVDRHWVDRFGSAILLSVVGGAAQFLGNYGQDSGGTGGGTVVTTTDPVTGLITQAEAGGGQSQFALQARQIAAQNTSQTMTNIAQEALKNSIDIPPTITLDQGTRIIVFVRRDLDFSAFYPDPVKEALRELKRERAGGQGDGLSR